MKIIAQSILGHFTSREGEVETSSYWPDFLLPAKVLVKAITGRLPNGVFHALSQLGDNKRKYLTFERCRCWIDQAA